MLRFGLIISLDDLYNTIYFALENAKIDNLAFFEPIKS